MRTFSKLPFTRSLRMLAVMALVLPALAALPLARDSSAYVDMNLEMPLPSFAGTLEKVPCTLTVTGGPAFGLETSNYSFKAEIVADNATGSSVAPSTGSGSTGVFRLNITMPGEGDQTIRIRINATSRDTDSGDSETKVREFEIKVAQTILIRATVYNTGSVDAEDVSAKFYADGIYLGTKTFDVKAGSSKLVSCNWTWVNVDNGEHEVKVVIDDADGIVEFSNGDNVYTMTVYVGKAGNPLGGILTIGVIIMSVFVFLTYLQKPARGKK